MSTWTALHNNIQSISYVFRIIGSNQKIPSSREGGEADHINHMVSLPISSL